MPQRIDPSLDENAKFLIEWIENWLTQMHKDISNEERGKIADEMCCEWFGGGVGVSFTERFRESR